MSDRDVRREPPFTRRDLDELDALRRALPRTAIGGYEMSAVDAFLDRATGALRAAIDESEGVRAGVDPENLWFRHRQDRLTVEDVEAVTFPVVRIAKGYRMRPVDELLDTIAGALSRLLSERDRVAAPSERVAPRDEPPRFPVDPEGSDSPPPAWLVQDDPSTAVQRFALVRRGYDTDEVDAYVTLVEGWISTLKRRSPKPDEVRTGPTSDLVRRREFATVRRGYDPDQVRDHLIALAADLERLEPRATGRGSQA